MKAFPDTFSIIDTETTGMHPSYARIIDIGIIRVEQGVVVKRYETLVNPGEPIPRIITRLTGITDEIVKDAPSFSDVALEVEKHLAGAVFVAHHAAFDYGFVKHEMFRAGIDWSAESLCTVLLSRKLFPGERSHSLEAIIERYGIGVDERHRALPDAEAVLEFMESISREVEPRVLERALRIRETGTREKFPAEERSIS